MYLKFVTTHRITDKFIHRRFRYMTELNDKEFSHKHENASIKISLIESNRIGGTVEKKHIGYVGTMILIADGTQGIIQTFFRRKQLREFYRYEDYSEYLSSRPMKGDIPEGIFDGERLTYQRAKIEKQLQDLIDKQDIPEQEKWTLKDKFLSKLYERLPTDEKTVRSEIERIKTSKKS